MQNQQEYSCVATYTYINRLNSSSLGWGVQTHQCQHIHVPTCNVLEHQDKGLKYTEEHQDLKYKKKLLVGGTDTSVSTHTCAYL